MLVVGVCESKVTAGHSLNGGNSLKKVVVWFIENAKQCTWEVSASITYKSQKNETKIKTKLFQMLSKCLFTRATNWVAYISYNYIMIVDIAYLFKVGNY